MQRIQRSTLAFADMDEQSLNMAHALLTYCPTHIASLLAQPRAGQNNQLEWWSPLGGQPIAYTDLTLEQRTALVNLYQQRLASLQQLSQQANNPTLSHLVATLPKQPVFDHLYSLNQQPVMINWHHFLHIQQPEVIPMAAAVTPPPARHKKFYMWLWLLLIALILAGLIAIYLWIRNTPQSAVPAPIEVLVVLPEPEPIIEPEIEPITIVPEPIVEAPKIDVQVVPKPAPPKPKPRPKPAPAPKPKPKPEPKVDPSCGCPL